MRSRLLRAISLDLLRPSSFEGLKLLPPEQGKLQGMCREFRLKSELMTSVRSGEASRR